MEIKVSWRSFSTDFDNFAEDLAEAHGEGVRFLLEQVAAGLSPFQPSLHDGLSPASPNKAYFKCCIWIQPITSRHDSNISRCYPQKAWTLYSQHGQQFSSFCQLWPANRQPFVLSDVPPQPSQMGSHISLSHRFDGRDACMELLNNPGHCWC